LTPGEQNSRYRQHFRKECTALRAVFGGQKYGPSRKSSGIARNCNVLIRKPRKVGGWHYKCGAYEIKLAVSAENSECDK